MKKVILLILITISFSLQASQNGYEKLKMNLDGNNIDTAGWYTVFCNLDINFSSSRFSWFLQNSDFAMTIVDESVKISPTSFAMRFIPRVTSKTEFIDVNYTVELTTKHKGIYGDEGDEVAIVKKVEISGTPDLMLKLFIIYWQYGFNIEDRKGGELANYIYMGDRISLQSINLRSSKIIITPHQFDYKLAFGIE